MRLSDREHQLLVYAANGLTDREIGSELSISRDTVSSYWRRILLKYGASSRTECVARYSQQETIDLVNEKQEENQRLVQEVEIWAHAQAREEVQKEMLAAINKATLAYVKCGNNFAETFASLLADVLRLTDCEYGILGEVIHDGDISAVQVHAITVRDRTTPGSNGVRRLQHDHIHARNLDRLFGDMLLSHKCSVHQSLTDILPIFDLPAGHCQVATFVSIPVIEQGELIGAIGLGNRSGGFPQEMIDFLQPIVSACATYIVGWRMKLEQQRVQKRANAADTLIRDLIDRLPTGVLFETTDGRIDFVNQTFLALFGLQDQVHEAIGTLSDDLIRAAFRGAAEPAMATDRQAELRATSKTTRGDIVAFRDGRKLLQDLFVIRSGQAVRGFLWCYRDVTNVANGYSQDSSQDATIGLVSSNSGTRNGRTIKDAPVGGEENLWLASVS
ncbi:MAG: GAF domain-containing protein [Fimbriimonas sp.]|nr:GAF domain-containing protein [Fimbriimonas sp.]